MDDFVYLTGKTKEEIIEIYSKLEIKRKIILKNIKETENMLRYEHSDYMRILDLRDDIRAYNTRLAGVNLQLNRVEDYAVINGIELIPKTQEKVKLKTKKN